MTTKPRVFISYARHDATDFALWLHDELEKREIEAWLDSKDMPGGNPFITEIDEAIRACDYFLLVATPKATASKYCRDEWQKALAAYKPIIPILKIGEYDDLPQEGLIYLHDAPDFRTEADYATGLEKLLTHLRHTPRPGAKTYGVPNLPEYYLERPTELEQLEQSLTAHKTTALTSITRQMGVQGMGGIGKTILAQALTQRYLVRRSFPDGIYWLTLGKDVTSMVEIWRRLGQWLTGTIRTFNTPTEAADFFEEATRDKDCLIILDDLWEASHAEAFTRLGERCRLVLTSRFADQLEQLGIGQPLEVGLLSTNQAHELLANTSGLKTANNLPPQADPMIQQCDHLPLALSMIGAMVKGQTEAYWGDVLAALQAQSLADIEATFPDYPYPSLFAAIAVSIDALEPELRERYYDFAVFPDDIDIPEVVPLIFWQPLSGLQARKRLKTLVQRNLLRRTPTNDLTIHDLQLAFVRQRCLDLPARQARLLSAYNPESKPWYEIPHDGYLYFQLAYHLIQAGRKPELIQLLVGSPEWMEKKYITCLGDTSLVQDLELAWADFADPLTPEQVLDLVQLYTLRQVVNARVSTYDDTMLKTLVYLGRTEEALSHARLRSDYQAQAQGLLAIFDIFHSQGRINLILLNEIHPIVLKIENINDRTRMLGEIAVTMALVDQFESALSVADGIEDARSHAIILRAIAKIMADVKDKRADATLSQAIDVTTKIKGFEDRIWLWCEIVVMMAQMGTTPIKTSFNVPMKIIGEITEMGSRVNALLNVVLAMAAVRDDQMEVTLLQTLKEAEEVKEDKDRAKALVDIALTMEKIGDDRVEVTLFRALDIARKAKEVWVQEWMQQEIALAMVQVGQFETALRVVNGIGLTKPYDVVLSEIANVMAKDGQFDQALNIAYQIKEQDYRVDALRNIGFAIAQTEQFDQALKVVSEIESAWDRESGWQGVAVMIAWAGQFDSALEVVGRIKKPELQTKAMKSIAEIMAKRGNKQAEHILTKTIELASGIEKTGTYAESVGKIAVAIAQMGKFNHALEIASHIKKRFLYAEARNGIIRSMAQMGEFTQALGVANRIEDAWDHAEAFSEIAVAMAQTGHLDLALKIVDGLDFTLSQRVLSEIAVIMTQAGQSDLALKLVGNIEIEARGRVLSDIAVIMAKLGDKRAKATLSQVLDITGELDSALPRARMLSKVAESMAEMWDQRAESTMSQALEVVSEIEETDLRISAVSEIAQAMARGGQFEPALKVVSEIEEANSRSWTMRKIAQAMAQRGQFDRSLGATHRIEDTMHRAEALRSIAQAMTQYKQILQAFKTLPLENEPANYLKDITSWQSSFEQIETGFTLKVLREATRIVAWVKPAWAEIHAILVQATEEGGTA